MSGVFSAGGLITGIDSNNLIRQLIQIERAPILRFQSRIDILEQQKDTLREIRTQLLDLRNMVQDFQFGLVFEQFETTSSEDTVLTAGASGSNPSVGSFDVNVIQLASATVATSSASLGQAIDPAVALNSAGFSTAVTSGTFSINGVSISVDPSAQSLNTILGLINGSAAGVTATYDAVSDKVTLVNSGALDTSIINFGATDDTSNFLATLNVDNATQATGGGGSTEVTSTRNLGAVNPGSMLNTVNFAGGMVTAGAFKINGVSITVDPTADGLSDVLERITNSDAGVTATYDTATDTIRVVSDTLGSRTIRFESDTSNFLAMTNLTAAVQSAGNDSQFTVNGGAVQTRNTNDVTDAVGDVTLTFLSVGTSTVAVSTDNEAIIEDVQGFIESFNEAVTSIREATANDGNLSGDASIRTIENFLRTTIFGQVSGLSGDFQSLIDIGISTGDTFDASAIPQLELDEDDLREAILEDRVNVARLFANDSKTGIGDLIFAFLDELTGFSGSLNARFRGGGSVDDQIETLNDRIANVERRVAQREARLRAQFSRLEQLASGFQSQASFLSGIGGGFRLF